jgi:hypothetical protein
MTAGKPPKAQPERPDRAVSGPSASPIGIWLHSQEEDRSDVRVYRPRDYAFPPARGRSAVEFRPDGTYVEYSDGPDDRGQSVVGEWRDTGDGRVQATTRTATRRILSCTKEMLVIEG